MANELYEKFKAIGVDMSWYEKTRGTAQRPDERPAPLTDDQCGMLSIYLLQKSGKMFTVTTKGEPYEQVRKVKPIARDIYLCACCKQQFSDYGRATDHYAKATEEATDGQETEQETANS